MDTPELSNEDSLRINVMMAQTPLAIRIDESRLTLTALTGQGEVRVQLNPHCEEQAYLRRVKALLSELVMGSPGGYPVFLKRWTRMGQTRDANLAQLLLLGESEAVVAVAHAPGLTEALAQRAWWAMPDAANARQMLKRRVIAKSPLGLELAAFLLEFLPFEEEAGNMMESVRLILQPGLVSEQTTSQLWQRAQMKRSMLVGFLHSRPNDLPLELAAHPALDAVDQDDDMGQLLGRVLSPQGQAFLKTCEQALARVSDQEVAISLFDAIADYFSRIKFSDQRYRDINTLQQAVRAVPITQPAAVEDLARSALLLSALTEELLNPIFAKTDAVGSGLRRKIRPVTDVLLTELRLLQA